MIGSAGGLVEFVREQRPVGQLKTRRTAGSRSGAPRARRCGRSGRGPSRRRTRCRSPPRRSRARPPHCRATACASSLPRARSRPGDRHHAAVPGRGPGVRRVPRRGRRRDHHRHRRAATAAGPMAAARAPRSETITSRPVIPSGASERRVEHGQRTGARGPHGAAQRRPAAVAGRARQGRRAPAAPARPRRRRPRARSTSATGRRPRRRAGRRPRARTTPARCAVSEARSSSSGTILPHHPGPGTGPAAGGDLGFQLPAAPQQWLGGGAVLLDGAQRLDGPAQLGQQLGRSRRRRVGGRAGSRFGDRARPLRRFAAPLPGGRTRGRSTGRARRGGARAPPLQCARSMLPKLAW